MDIYSFINSPDTADYCRRIRKTWTPFEMAMIISRSRRTMKEKHEAWRELITNYPDMPTPKNMHYNSFDSLHNKLEKILEYEGYALKIFMAQEPCAVYKYMIMQHDRERHSESVFTSFENAFEDMRECWEKDEAPRITMIKVYLDGSGSVRVIMDYDRNPIRIYVFSYSRWSFFDIDYYYYYDIEFFNNMFYIDIPMPFKAGDILTIRSEDTDEKNQIFILGPPDESSEKRRSLLICGEIGDGTDMTEWGLFVSDEGILYGDHAMKSDSFEYYRGELKGNNRLLHYVSMYMKGEIRLPELLVMQCRIMLENLLDKPLDFKNHRCIISEHQLAENRIVR